MVFVKELLFTQSVEFLLIEPKSRIPYFCLEKVIFAVILVNNRSDAGRLRFEKGIVSTAQTAQQAQPG